MSDSVRIVEVGPRDGLQNEKTPVSVADRIAFIEALVDAGLGCIPSRSGPLCRRKRSRRW
jgi:isopropylmalate/homocitrate/citramalate synthase